MEMARTMATITRSRGRADAHVQGKPGDAEVAE